MNSPFNSETFRQSRPVLLTTFINSVGAIGLGLVPILLVNRGVSTAEGALVLTAMKVMIPLGTLGGGALTDRVSSRTLILGGLLAAVAAIGALPFQRHLLLIAACAVVAQFSGSLLVVSQRTLLMHEVDSHRQKEALGWMRMASNFASIFTYSIAAAGARLGVTPLMLFDAGSSFVAFLMGRRILPAAPPAPAPGRGLTGGRPATASRAVFFGCAFVFFGWAFLYEIFLEGGTGRLEVLHPGEGLRRFSLMMILNTVLCAAFAVKATQFFEDSIKAIAWGLALTFLGVLVAVWGMAVQAWVLAGMFLVTLGELMLGAVAQYTLMRLVPSASNAGFYYSAGLTLMQCGRIAGAALAFPLLIHASSLRTFTGLTAGIFLVQLVLLFRLRGEISLNTR